ncbi:MAG: hypothetical protein WC813_00890 [Patescibacteria group bacterium]|jgi:hypothetical protein
MTTRLIAGIITSAVLLTAGWGCAKTTPSIPLEGGSGEPEVKGVVDELPDGKGPAPFELCISTDGPVTGAVWLYAANNTAPRLNWTQWFSADPVAAGDAGQEICGALNFSIESGDTLYLNGTWSKGKNFLVNNRGEQGTPSDQIKEIWLDDQFYEIGRDCAYENNNMGGYNLACTVR